MQKKTGLALLFDGIGTAFRDAVILSIISAVVAIVINSFFYSEGIPFIAKNAYEILVPCPVSGGKVIPIAADDPKLKAKETYIVDARTEDIYKKWHLHRALNVTYDYLDPTPKDVVQKVAKEIAKSRAQIVVVYGDGEDPDTGEQLGKELSSSGIKNVFFVKGGAQTLMKIEGGGQ